MAKKNSIVVQFYIIYLVSVFLNFVPSHLISTFGSLLFLVIFIATYIYRSKHKENNFIHSHMVFIIKSIWISSLILIVGIILAYLLGDHSIIETAIAGVKRNIYLTEYQINEILMNYLKHNAVIFGLTLMPAIIYLIYRLARGLKNAKQQKPIKNLKSWL